MELTTCTCTDTVVEHQQPSAIVSQSKPYPWSLTSESIQHRRLIWKKIKIDGGSWWWPLRSSTAKIRGHISNTRSIKWRWGEGVIRHTDRDLMTTMKKILVAVLIVSMIASHFENVASDAFDCYDACTTGCVQQNTRLMRRCETKCGIKCGQNSEVEDHTGWRTCNKSQR